MTRTRRRTATLVGALAALTAGALAVPALAITAPTDAAYTDRSHARSEAIGVRATPPAVLGLGNSRMVDTGIGLAESGDVYMWGRTDLGIGGNLQNPGTSRPPTRVEFPAGTIRQVSGQIYGANALDATGQVWGVAGTAGAAAAGLDAALPGGAPQPIRIGTAHTGAGEILDDVMLLSTSEQAGAGIRADGTVWVWGQTAFGGNTGVGASQLAGLPDPAEAGNRPAVLKGTYRQFFVILENGDVYAWGGGGGTAPGGMATTAAAKPVDALAPWMRANVADGEPYVTAVDGGISLGVALLSDGTVLNWGSTALRIGGRPTGGKPTTTPGLVPGLEGIVSVQAGYTGVAMLDGTGRLWGYGASDDYGKFPTTPAVIDTDVVQLGAGQGYYLWQTADGAFHGRGYNPAGAIGTPAPATVTANRPVSYDMTVVTR